MKVTDASLHNIRRSFFTPNASKEVFTREQLLPMVCEEKGTSTYVAIWPSPSSLDTAVGSSFALLVVLYALTPSVIARGGDWKPGCLCVSAILTWLRPLQLVLIQRPWRRDNFQRTQDSVNRRERTLGWHVPVSNWSSQRLQEFNQ